MNIRFVDQQGIIRGRLPAGTGYDKIVALGQVLADQHKRPVRAYQGALTKIGSFKPAA